MLIPHKTFDEGQNLGTTQNNYFDDRPKNKKLITRQFIHREVFYLFAENMGLMSLLIYMLHRVLKIVRNIVPPEMALKNGDYQTKTYSKQLMS